MLETPTIAASGPAACPHLNPGPHELRPGVVSVILVNYKGAEDTIACLRHFDEVDWPEERLELIVIENDSRDGSARAIAEARPGAGVPGRNGGHGLLHTLMGPTIVVGVAHEAGQFDPLALHRDDGQEERLQVEDAYKVSQRDDGDGEVAAHLVPVQRPGPPPCADAEPTGVHVQALTVVQNEDDPDEATEHHGNDHYDHPDVESVRQRVSP